MRGALPIAIVLTAILAAPGAVAAAASPRPIVVRDGARVVPVGPGAAEDIPLAHCWADFGREQVIAGYSTVDGNRRASIVRIGGTAGAAAPVLFDLAAGDGHDAIAGIVCDPDQASALALVETDTDPGAGEALEAALVRVERDGTLGPVDRLPGVVPSALVALGDGTVAVAGRQGDDPVVLARRTTGGPAGEFGTGGTLTLPRNGPGAAVALTVAGNDLLVVLGWREGTTDRAAIRAVTRDTGAGSGRFGGAAELVVDGAMAPTAISYRAPYHPGDAGQLALAGAAPDGATRAVMTGGRGETPVSAVRDLGPGTDVPTAVVAEYEVLVAGRAGSSWTAALLRASDGAVVTAPFLRDGAAAGKVLAWRDMWIQDDPGSNFGLTGPVPGGATGVDVATLMARVPPPCAAYIVPQAGAATPVVGADGRASLRVAVNGTSELCRDLRVLAPEGFEIAVDDGRGSGRSAFGPSAPLTGTGLWGMPNTIHLRYLGTSRPGPSSVRLLVSDPELSAPAGMDLALKWAPVCDMSIRIAHAPGTLSDRGQQARIVLMFKNVGRLKCPGGPIRIPRGWRREYGWRKVPALGPGGEARATLGLHAPTAALRDRSVLTFRVEVPGDGASGNDVAVAPRAIVRAPSIRLGRVTLPVVRLSGTAGPARRLAEPVAARLLRVKRVEVALRRRGRKTALTYRRARGTSRWTIGVPPRRPGTFEFHVRVTTHGEAITTRTFLVEV